MRIALAILVLLGYTYATFKILDGNLEDVELKFIGLFILTIFLECVILKPYILK